MKKDNIERKPLGPGYQIIGIFIKALVVRYLYFLKCSLLASQIWPLLVLVKMNRPLNHIMVKIAVDPRGELMPAETIRWLKFTYCSYRKIFTSYSTYLLFYWSAVFRKHITFLVKLNPPSLCNDKDWYKRKPKFKFTDANLSRKLSRLEIFIWVFRSQIKNMVWAD